MDQQEVIERQNEELQDVQQVAEATTEAQPIQSEPETPAQATEATQPEEHEPETMQEALDQYGDSMHLKRGEIKVGKIISKTDGGFLIDVGFKCEGFLPIKEYTNHSLIEASEEPKPGDEIEVAVVSVRDTEDAAQLLLSRWRHEFDKRWAELEAKVAEGPVMTVKGVSKVKGGLMVNSCGLEGFIPISHLAMAGRNVNPSNYVGKDVKVKILDHDKKKHRLVFSRRELLEEAEKERKEKFYERVHEGDVLEGKVSSLTDFGVFVNLGEMDGLVHLTEITWKRSFKLKDMFKKDDKVTVKVTGIDREKDRISLSIKQVNGDPWDTVSERIHKGDVFKGTVTNITDFGAFVEVEPGVEGLVHIGDISWARIKKPRDVFKKGQEVDVMVLDIDLEKKHLSLGCKQLNDPWADADKRYPAGSDIKVKVVRLADFGAFVEVEEGVEALVHISQLSRKRVENPADVLHEGDEIVTRVLEVNPEQRRMRLSLSALEPEPEPEPVPQAVEKEQPKQEKRGQKFDRPERSERPEKSERRERKNKSRSKALKESAGYEDDGETLEYNPFAEFFKDADWDEKQ